MFLSTIQNNFLVSLIESTTSIGWATVSAELVVAYVINEDTTISLKIERALKAKLLVLARLENRSLSNFIEKLLKGEVAKYESKRGRVRVD